jgi:hypothetical protein
MKKFHVQLLNKITDILDTFMIKRCYEILYKYENQEIIP